VEKGNFKQLEQETVFNVVVLGEIYKRMLLILLINLIVPDVTVKE
jgi:hypothetical protein